MLIRTAGFPFAVTWCRPGAWPERPRRRRRLRTGAAGCGGFDGELRELVGVVRLGADQGRGRADGWPRRGRANR